MKNTFEMLIEFDFAKLNYNYQDRVMIQNAINKMIENSGCIYTLKDNEYSCLGSGTEQDNAIVYMNLIGILCHSLLTQGIVKKCIYIVTDDTTGTKKVLNELPYILSEQKRISRRKLLKYNG